MSRTERKQKVQSEKKKSRKARFENSIKKESGVTSGEKKVKGKKFQRFKNWFSGLKTWKKVLFVAGIVILVLALTVGAIAYSYFNDIFGEIHEPTPEDYDLSLVDVDGYYNILLLGVDSRNMDKLKGTRSDAIMIVSINKDTNDVKITSVYRDTYLKMGDTSTYDKITHACAYGGPEMSMKSLNQAMDLNISNYVVVNFKAVADLVDAVGGIEVDVQQYEIQQLNKYTKETANNIGRKKYKLVESPGVQTLEGVQAVSYGRIRKGVGDDFKRTERMRTVMSLVMDKMKEMPFKEIKKLIKIMTPQVQTNLTKGNILGLAFRLPQYNISTGDGWPYKVTTGSINGGSYVFPANLANNVKELHAKLFARMDYSPSSMVVTISNAIISRLEAERAAGTITNEKTPVVDTPDTNTGTGGTGDGTGGTGDGTGGIGDGTGGDAGGSGDGSGGDAGSGDGSGGDAGSGGGTGDGN